MIVIEATGLTEAIDAMTGAGAEIRKRWLSTAYRMGAVAIEYLLINYRTVRSSISTGVITGLLRRSYSHAAANVGQDAVDLQLGGINAGERVLRYFGVHEFGATYARRKTNKVYGGRPALAPTAAWLTPQLQEQASQDVRDAVLKRAA